MFGVAESVWLKDCRRGGVDLVQRERLTRRGGETHAQQVERLFQAQQDQWPVRGGSERLDNLPTVASMKFLLELRDLIGEGLEARHVVGGERIEAPEGGEDVHKPADESYRGTETRSVRPSGARAESKTPQARDTDHRKLSKLAHGFRAGGAVGALLEDALL